MFSDPFSFQGSSDGRIDSAADIYEDRSRVCDLGYLQELYRRENGTLGHRCAAEPVEDYLKKGGSREDTEGRKCLCNGLLANVGYPQVRKTGCRERTLVTSGNGVNKIARFLGNGKTSYTALDVVRYLLHEESAGGSRTPVGSGAAIESGST